MHIFITGIAGFLGSNLADFIIKSFKVSGCDNLTVVYRQCRENKINFLKEIVKI